MINFLKTPTEIRSRIWTMCIEQDETVVQDDEQYICPGCQTELILDDGRGSNKRLEVLWVISRVCSLLRLEVLHFLLPRIWIDPQGHWTLSSLTKFLIGIPLSHRKLLLHYRIFVRVDYYDAACDWRRLVDLLCPGKFSSSKPHRLCLLDADAETDHDSIYALPKEHDDVSTDSGLPAWVKGIAMLISHTKEFRMDSQTLEDAVRCDQIDTVLFKIWAPILLEKEQSADVKAYKMNEPPNEIKQSAIPFFAFPDAVQERIMEFAILPDDGVVHLPLPQPYVSLDENVCNYTNFLKSGNRRLALLAERIFYSRALFSVCHMNDELSENVLRWLSQRNTRQRRFLSHLSVCIVKDLYDVHPWKSTSKLSRMPSRSYPKTWTHPCRFPLPWSPGGPIHHGKPLYSNEIYASIEPSQDLFRGLAESSEQELRKGRARPRRGKQDQDTTDKLTPEELHGIATLFRIED